MRGFIIGAVASAIKDGFNLISRYVLHFAKLTYADFAGILLYGRPIRSTLDFINAQIVELAFEGVVGVIFIYFAYRTKSKRNLWFKGIIFADAIYFTAYAAGTVFRLPQLSRIPVETAISNLITSSLFGALMGLGVYWWGRRIGDFGKERVKVI